MREQRITRVVNQTGSRRRRLVVHLACGHKGTIPLKSLGNFGPPLLMGYVKSWPCPLCEDLPQEELVREVVTELADALQVALLLVQRSDDVDLRRVIYRAALALERLQPRMVPEPQPAPVWRRPRLTASRS
jgi:hypothetical protein